MAPANDPIAGMMSAQSPPITSHDDALASRVRIVKYLIAIITIKQKGPVSRAAGRTLNLIGYTDHNIPD
jgi:hypothetical protein